MSDPLAERMRLANDAHAAALATGDDAAITAAYLAALKAERDLLQDSGGPADLEAARLLQIEIDDLEAS